uniref:Uncharacterized protein n=1 Tax=Timspurckia oligopyrenoides TaxID=708627 RepID=A0A7S0ZD58_9RHOD|mmetsp:Transcript_1316/g.2410  ORF Transcript_1316/g.2410 Transcript_1316/m.2410 type:complete len:110 (+) Transcript_1316:340-669(+)
MMHLTKRIYGTKERLNRLGIYSQRNADYPRMDPVMIERLLMLVLKYGEYVNVEGELLTVPSLERMRTLGDTKLADYFESENLNLFSVARNLELYCPQGPAEHLKENSLK